MNCVSLKQITTLECHKNILLLITITTPKHTYLIKQGIKDVEELEHTDQDEVPWRVLWELGPYLSQASHVDQGLVTLRRQS